MSKEIPSCHGLDICLEGISYLHRLQQAQQDMMMDRWKCPVILNNVQIYLFFLLG